MNAELVSLVCVVEVCENAELASLVCVVEVCENVELASGVCRRCVWMCVSVYVSVFVWCVSEHWE